MSKPEEERNWRNAYPTQRGGRREGAGRKATGPDPKRTRITLHISKALLRKIDRLRRSSHNRSEFIAICIRKALGLKDDD